jgi:hypothetical protein
MRRKEYQTLHAKWKGIERGAALATKSHPARKGLSNASITLLPQTSSRLEAMRTQYAPASDSTASIPLPAKKSAPTLTEARQKQRRQ